MNYYVVLTDWRNSGMLVHVVENEALVFLTRACGYRLTLLRIFNLA